MPPSPAQLFDDAAVYRRTAAGQRALTRPLPSFTRQTLRLLSLVNGYTALRDLLELGFASEDVLDDLKLLVSCRLVELIPPPRPSRF